MQVRGRHAAGAAALLIAAALGTYESIPDRTAKRLMTEEGFRSHPYADTRGIETIGFGTAIGEGISRAEGELLLRERLGTTWDELGDELPRIRNSALLDLAYQVGVRGVLEFHDMIAALRRGDCQAARKAALDSLWASQTPDRAHRVAAMLCGPERSD